MKALIFVMIVSTFSFYSFAKDEGKTGPKFSLLSAEERASCLDEKKKVCAGKEGNDCLALMGKSKKNLNPKCMVLMMDSQVRAGLTKRASCLDAVQKQCKGAESSEECYKRVKKTIPKDCQRPAIASSFQEKPSVSRQVERSRCFKNLRQACAHIKLEPKQKVSDYTAKFRSCLTEKMKKNNSQCFNELKGPVESEAKKNDFVNF